MIVPLETEPWRSLPPRVADVIEPELDAITAEILATIAAEVPEYARPLEGRFGRGIRTGVGEALRQFVALVRDPGAGRDPGREVYVELGRGEFRQGRTLDSLQAAYRVGARVAWRRIAAAGRRAELEAEPLSLLAEAIFAYIDELAADSVDGYAEAQREVEDLRRRRRHELAALLLREPPAERADVVAAARAAGWELPRRAAAIACAESEVARVGRGLPPEALIAVVEGFGCVLLPDPDGPGRAEQVARAAAVSPLALGPAGELPALPRSWTLAATLLRAVAAGALPRRDGLLKVDDHLADLLLFEGAGLAARIAERRLAPLEGLTEKARTRMRETALAHVRHNGNAVAMAAELHIHPQTARHRIARLRELFGEALDDPDARFELEIALRV
jgi:PucR C-terminal helix-turn-helix domain